MYRINQHIYLILQNQVLIYLLVLRDGLNNTITKPIKELMERGRQTDIRRQP